MKRIVIVLSLIFPLTAFAQFKGQIGARNFGTGMRTAGLLDMLGLDPSRFSMTQSYTLSYAAVGNRGFTQGLYLNTLRYQFSEPLSVAVQVGMAHQPLAIPGAAPILNNGLFLSGAQLRWQPSANTVLQLDFHRYPVITGFRSAVGYPFMNYNE
ncbi:MAG: hypothetical protein ONB24_07485 [candidate division KSB1 bacterium]|nr:hypothetical protein [candidate division KSB1 bacterium]